MLSACQNVFYIGKGDLDTPESVRIVKYVEVVGKVPVRIMERRFCFVPNSSGRLHIASTSASRSRSSVSLEGASVDIVLDWLLPTRQAHQDSRSWTNKWLINMHSLNDQCFDSIVGKGNLVANQPEESFCSCSRIKPIDGRLDSRFSYSSDQLSCRRFHNPSLNPVLGLSGRPPSVTFFTMLPSEVLPNG
jgi:hypothetical protein